MQGSCKLSERTLVFGLWNNRGKKKRIYSRCFELLLLSLTMLLDVNVPARRERTVGSNFVVGVAALALAMGTIAVVSYDHYSRAGALGVKMTATTDKEVKADRSAHQTAHKTITKLAGDDDCKWSYDGNEVPSVPCSLLRSRSRGRRLLFQSIGRACAFYAGSFCSLASGRALMWLVATSMLKTCDEFECGLLRAACSRGGCHVLSWVSPCAGA